MRLVFFGGGEFAATVLKKLAQVHEVALVVTPPPAPAGRKMVLTAPPAAQRAQHLNLPLAHGISPDQLRVQTFCGGTTKRYRRSALVAKTAPVLDVPSAIEISVPAGKHSVTPANSIALVRSGVLSPLARKVIIFSKLEGSSPGSRLS